MKIVSGIDDPFLGELVLAVDPPLQPHVAPDWRRRLNLYPGRSLSDIALRTEQVGRSGRLSYRGRTVSPGVVRGLTMGLEGVGLESPDSEPLFTTFCHIGAGTGISAQGEDVFIPKALRLAVGDLPVNAAVTLLDGEEAAHSGTGQLQPRRLSRRALRELVADGVSLPPVAILVLQPVVVEASGRADPRDQCEIDPSADAFADWQLVEATRLVLYAWPGEWRPLPMPGPRWRNRLSHTIYEAEKWLDAGTYLPWETMGVPIGLLGFDPDWRALFVDRHAVVRAGGKPKRRSLLLPDSGNPFLWQARIQQFAGQVAETVTADATIEALAAQFRYLPPAGLLPRDAVTPRPKGGDAAHHDFFPSHFHVEAIAMPTEQLDLALESSASLQSYDVETADRVQVLIPVPQVWYEPDVLEVKQVAGEFQETIDEFVDTRAHLLQRREDVRHKRRTLLMAIDGSAPDYPVPDPDALEAEAVASGTLEPEEALFGTTTVLGDDGLPLLDEAGRPLLRVDEITALRGYLDESTPLTSSELDALSDEGLVEFIESLELKIKKAEDKIDFGFTRVQTDMYRLRRLMLGEVGASRLATSPALAEIAKDESAYTLRQDLQNYLDSVSGQSSAPVDDNGDDGGGDDGGGGESGQGGGGRTLSLNFGSNANIGDLTLAGSGSQGRRGRGGSRRSGPGSGGSRGDDIVLDEALIDARQPGRQDPGIRELREGLRFDSGAGGSFFLADSATEEEISEKSPIVGKPSNFRTVTVADRLVDPPAAEAKNFSVATKYEIVKGLSELDISLEGVEIPGFYSYTENPDGSTELDFDDYIVTLNDVEKTKRRPREIALDLATIRNDNLAEEIIRDRHDLDPINADETEFFAAGVRALDHTIAALRLVEGRIQAYKQAINRCQESLTVVRTLVGGTNSRLQVVATELAEARHDVAVARALLAEEIAHVAAINKRRDYIIDTHVDFVAYRRPRVCDLLLKTPVYALEPGPEITSDPVQTCLDRDGRVPSELEDMVEMLRQLPVRWFPDVAILLNRLDKPHLLREALVAAQAQAQRTLSAQPQFAGQHTTFGRAISQTISSQYQVVRQHQLQVSQLEIGRMEQLSWRRTRDKAAEILSLGDLIEGKYGRRKVSREAANVLQDFIDVATCLYARFSAVEPRIRLIWAEQLSQHDGPVNLRNLTKLPRWREIDHTDSRQVANRRELQQLVDWLHQRVDSRQRKAVQMINDLIRICILLASHAPVDEIIGGQVEEETTIRRGGRVVVTADPRRVRIGMPVLIYRQTKVVARAEVVDISAQKAAAEVVQVMAVTASLPPEDIIGQSSLEMAESIVVRQGDRVQFGEKVVNAGGHRAAGYAGHGRRK